MLWFFYLQQDITLIIGRQIVSPVVKHKELTEDSLHLSSYYRVKYV